MDYHLSQRPTQLKESDDDFDNHFNHLKELLTKDIELLMCWIEEFPKYLSSYYELQIKPEKMYTIFDSAFVLCGKELIKIIELCLNPQKRHLKVFKEYQVREYESETASKEDKRGRNCLQLKLVDIMIS